jgi:hypothetical protein
MMATMGKRMWSIIPGKTVGGKKKLIGLALSIGQ